MNDGLETCGNPGSHYEMSSPKVFNYARQRRPGKSGVAKCEDKTKCEGGQSDFPGQQAQNPNSQIAPKRI